MVKLDYNREAELVVANRRHFCEECGWFIEPGQHYFSVAYNNGGLKGRIYPDRIHSACFQQYLDKKVRNYE